MPAAERDRLADFAGKVGRPMTWVVRDALDAYLAAVQADPEALERIKGTPYALTLDMNRPPVKGRHPGRPPKRGRGAK